MVAGPLIVIVGETASGKSALAHRLAQDFNGEIISADSWAVYRGFDVGTAKPSAAEQAEVPYHVIDVVDAREGFSAAVFKRLATKAIADITARGKLPIMAGGTGLYVDSILYDYGFLERPADELRAELNARTIPELLAMAEEGGLDTSLVDVRNKRRIIRLIENNGQMPSRGPLRAHTLVLGIQPSRDELTARIEARTDGMLGQGLEAEVQELAETYGWEVEPMKGVGYREFREQFEGTQSSELTRQRIISSTVQLAKKQRTWFKRNKSIRWFSTPVKYVDVVEIVTTFLSTM